MRKTILRIANLPRRFLEGRRNRKEAEKKQGDERRKHSANFWNKVEALVKEKGIPRMEAMRQVEEIYTELPVSKRKIV